MTTDLDRLIEDVEAWDDGAFRARALLLATLRAYRSTREGG